MNYNILNKNTNILKKILTGLIIFSIYQSVNKINISKINWR
jgi:hypothetical protein